MSGGGQAVVDCSVESRENEWGVLMLLPRLTRGVVDAYLNGGIMNAAEDDHGQLNIFRSTLC